MGGTKETKYVLTADAKGFSGAMRQARGEFADFVKGLSAGSGKLGEIAAAAGPAGLAVSAMAGGLAISGGAASKFLVDAAKQATELGGRLADLSTMSGTSAEAIQRLGANGKASFEQIAQSAASARKQLAKAPEEFEALGLSVKKLRSLNAEGLLLAISDRVKQLPPGFQQSAAAVAMMGKSGADSLPFLLSNLREAGAEAQRMGRILSNEDVAALDALSDAVKGAGKNWDGLVNQIGAAIATSPELLSLVDDVGESFGEMAHWIKENKELLRGFTDGVVGAARALGQMLGVQQSIQGARDLVGIGKTVGGFLGMNGAGGGSFISGHSSQLMGGEYDPELAGRIKKQHAEHEAAVKKLAQAYRDAAGDLRDFMSIEGRMAGPNSQMGGFRMFGAPTSADRANDSATNQGILNAAVPLEQRPEYIAEQAAGIRREREAEEAAALRDLNIAIYKTTTGLANLGSALEGAGADLRSIGKAIGGIGGGVVGLAGGVVGALGGIKSFDAMRNENALAGNGRRLTSAQKVQAGAAAAGTAYSIYEENKYNRSAGSGAMHGAASGAAAGSAYGPYGAIIGAVVGGIIGALSGSAFRKACKEAGKTLGGEVSDELGKAIMATAKKNKISNKDASLLHITDFMGETGKTATEMGPQIKGLFDAITNGTVPAKEGMAELNGLFDDLAAAAANGDKAAQKMTADLLQQGIAAGKLTDSMQAFVNDALGKMGGGASKILEGISMIGKDVPLGAMGTAAAQSFVAGFMAQIAQGGLVAALEASGSGIGDFYQRLMDEGNTAAAAMLEPWVQLEGVINGTDTTVKGFLTTLQGMSEVFGGLDQLGFATAGAFQGLETGIQGTVNALAEAGVTGPAALQAIAPELAQVIAAHEKYGFVIDESTQKLIDQAAAAGIAFPTDPIAQMVDLLKQLIVTLGGVPKELTVTTHFQTTGNPPPGALPESPEPTPAASGMGPMIAPNIGGGLGPLIQTHAGEGILIIPRSKVKARGLFHAARGVGREGEDGGYSRGPGVFRAGGGTSGGSGSGGGGGGGGGVSTGGGSGGDAAEEASRAVSEAMGSVAEEISSLTQAVARAAAAPPITLDYRPTVQIEDKSLVRTREGVEAFRDVLLPEVDRALRTGSGGIRTRIREIAEDVFKGR